MCIYSHFELILFLTRFSHPVRLAEPIPNQERALQPSRVASKSKRYVSVSEPAPNREQSQGPVNRTDAEPRVRIPGGVEEPIANRKDRESKGESKGKGACLHGGFASLGRRFGWFGLVCFASLGTAERHPSELLFIGAKVRKEADRIAERSSVTYFHRQERQPRGAEDCTGCGCRNLE